MRRALVFAALFAVLFAASGTASAATRGIRESLLGKHWGIGSPRHLIVSDCEAAFGVYTQLCVDAEDFSQFICDQVSGCLGVNWEATGGVGGGATVHAPVCKLIENVATDEQFDYLAMFDGDTTASSSYCQSFGANVDIDWEEDDGSRSVILSEVCTTSGVTEATLTGGDLDFADTDKLALKITDVTSGATGVFVCLFFE